MISQKRPYLIVPFLIEQPTWGGDYILGLKGWSAHENLQNKKIGQSYELFGRSKLLLTITDTDFNRFLPEFGSADGMGTANQDSHLVEGKDYVVISQLVKYMPLLVKMNQAYGNSFQLHIKPGVTHPHWKPKPESWYYFEPGLVTFGIKNGIEIDEYKRMCHAVNNMMTQLSHQVVAQELSLVDAQKQAQEFIQSHDPHRFVNLHETQKDSIIDLSGGAVHHSWEENREKFPRGNILYEVQLDVMDPLCTIRSFDQGKIKSDGGIRKIHIDDYFEFIDTDPSHNDIRNATFTRQGDRLLQTPYYNMDVVEVAGETSGTTGNSFVHLFVKEGIAEVSTNEGQVRVGTGHSCFIPQPAGFYKMKSFGQSATLLKTYLPTG